MFMLLDISDYHNDTTIVNVGDNCSDELLEPFDPLVTMADDCVVPRNYMCNGMQTCSNCTDEVHSNCLNFDCSGCKPVLLL